MATDKAYKVVLDTNQIVAAGSRWVDPIYDASKKPATELLRTVARDHTGLYSAKTMAEYVEKLLDHKHPPERVFKMCGLLAGAFQQVEITSTTCSSLPVDPDDVIFLLCAIDGKADLLVSEDGDLLGLKSAYSDFRIVSQSEAITELKT
jgi:predicted nucleic acid-binding protein